MKALTIRGVTVDTIAIVGDALNEPLSGSTANASSIVMRPGAQSGVLEAAALADRVTRVCRDTAIRSRLRTARPATSEENAAA